jgi:hypothetical protein
MPAQVRSLWLHSLRLLPVLLAVTVCGCAMVEAPGVATRRTLRMFKPNPRDWDHDAAADDGEWDEVGREGRGHMDREKDPDPWFKKFFMSERANAIERNLGID